MAGRLACLSLAVAISLFFQSANAAGAGRAFPVEAENFAIESFKKVNPNVEWDPTNYLVDLSGYYANCKQPLGKTKSEFQTPEGADIWVFVTSTRGNASDTNAVNGYIRDVINNWLSAGQISVELREAKRFGCSVRPVCSGSAVIACIGTDGKGNKPSQFAQTTRDPWADRNNGHGGGSGSGGSGTGGHGSGTGGHGSGTGGHGSGDGGHGSGGHGSGGTGGGSGGNGKGDHDGGKSEKDAEKGNLDGFHPKAYAFTSEQYDIAETILGNKWDRSHFLEDLSGLETDCSMVGRNDWHFDKIKTETKERNMKVTPQYGSSPNKGSTTDALKEILKTFKQNTTAKQLGCSIIPDCKTSSGMVVVISCLYQDA